MNKHFPITLLLLANSCWSWACTEPATDVMHTQTIGDQLTLTKLGHYCKAGNRFATDSLDEAISLDWAEYSFQLTAHGQHVDIASLVGGEGRLSKFSHINIRPVPATNDNIIALQLIARSSSNIYTEMHIAELVDAKLQPMATIKEPLTQYQSQQRSGSEYHVMGFYQIHNQHWIIDSLASAEEVASCNACQQYDVISWLWQDHQLSEYARRQYDIDSYLPLAE